MIAVARAAARNTYSTALLMLMSIGPSFSVIQGSSLNSFWGWNSSLRPSEPKMPNRPTTSASSERERDPDLALGAHQRFSFGGSGLRAASSNGRTTICAAK